MKKTIIALIAGLCISAQANTAFQSTRTTYQFNPGYYAQKLAEAGVSQEDIQEWLGKVKQRVVAQLTIIEYLLDVVDNPFWVYTLENRRAKLELIEAQLDFLGV